MATHILTPYNHLTLAGVSPTSSKLLPDLLPLKQPSPDPLEPWSRPSHHSFFTLDACSCHLHTV